MYTIISKNSILPFKPGIGYGFSSLDCANESFKSSRASLPALLPLLVVNLFLKLPNSDDLPFLPNPPNISGGGAAAE